MTGVFPITFEVPGNRECTDVIRLYALGLRGFGFGAGSIWEVPTDLDEVPPGPPDTWRKRLVVALRVLVPKGGAVPIDRHSQMPFYTALEALITVNMWCRRAKMRGQLPGGRAGFPSVYESVCYKPKVENEEELWDSTLALHQRGHGVCEDLACDRVAELRLVGETAWPELIPQQRPSGGVLFHVVVRRNDGSIEDPSGVLGMTPGLTNQRCRVFLREKKKKGACCANCAAGKPCEGCG